MLIESLDFAPLVQARAAGDWAAIGTTLADSARRLERAGAQGLALASNAMHKVYDEVADAVSIPVLHVADAVGARMQQGNVVSAALLGTREVASESFYRQRLVRYGIDLLPPVLADVEVIDRIIYDDLMVGRVTRAAERTLKSIVTTCEKRGARAIVLASSELGLVVDTRANVLPVFDATDIHCESIVEWASSQDET